jgi:hypothetical protein
VHVRGGVCLHVRVCVRVHVYKYQNAGLPSIRSVQYRNKKTNDAGTGPVLNQAKASPAFFWSSTGLKLLTPALVSWMPMPSYEKLGKFIIRSFLAFTAPRFVITV